MTMGKISLSRSALKNIAIISMLIDHVGALIIYNLYLVACYVDGEFLLGDLMPTKAKILYAIYFVMRCIGRIAFPIFCYMVVEGFLHTHSRPKYLLRLVIFALISEIPFDMDFGSGMIDFSCQNVIWLYVIAVLMMWVIERFGETQKSTEKRVVVTVIAIVVAGLLAYTCDYSFGGILLIASMYLFRDKKTYYWLGCIVSLIVIALISSWTELFAIVALLLLELYNGEKGKGSKYLFYIFYPAHLTLLGMASGVIYVLFEYGMI